MIFSWWPVVNFLRRVSELKKDGLELDHEKRLIKSLSQKEDEQTVANSTTK